MVARAVLFVGQNDADVAELSHPNVSVTVASDNSERESVPIIGDTIPVEAPGGATIGTRATFDPLGEAHADQPPDPHTGQYPYEEQVEGLYEEREEGFPAAAQRERPTPETPAEIGSPATPAWDEGLGRPSHPLGPGQTSQPGTPGPSSTPATPGPSSAPATPGPSSTPDVNVGPVATPDLIGPVATPDLTPPFLSDDGTALGSESVSLLTFTFVLASASLLLSSVGVWIKSLHVLYVVSRGLKEEYTSFGEFLLVLVMLITMGFITFEIYPNAWSNASTLYDDPLRYLLKNNPAFIVPGALTSSIIPYFLAFTNFAASRSIASLPREIQTKTVNKDEEKHNGDISNEIKEKTAKHM